MPQQVVTPSAARLTSSLRDVGYDLPSAVADIVDNSISANAKRVDVHIQYAGADSTVIIADDGSGMSANGVIEALRFGSRSTYPAGSLGKFGLGLKTASLSQARRLTVVSRRNGSTRSTFRRLDLDLIADWDEWIITDPGPKDATVANACRLLTAGFSTVVIWDRLDRVLPEKRPEGGWARRRFEALIEKTKLHLSMVFSRFIESGTDRAVAIVVNGEKIDGWEPLASQEASTMLLQDLTFELEVGDHSGKVYLERSVLPTRTNFSTPNKFDRLGGPLRWNRQQGLYFYRAGRLIQGGGWAGLRAIDEHTKLARASLTFDPSLDELFNVNVSKMRVSLPSQLRSMLHDPLFELCSAASGVYRSANARFSGQADDSNVENNASGRPRATVRTAQPPASQNWISGNAGDVLDGASVSIALRSAALQTGDYDALRRIAAVLSESAPDLVDALRLDRL